MKKRGLSNVVATVFIILMTIIAALLIWFYVRSSITESSERVQMQEKCYVIETELQSCDYGGPLQTLSGNIFLVTGFVKLKQGDSTEIRVAYYSEDGTSAIQNLKPINILETKKIVPLTTMKKQPAYAIASPIVYNQDKSKNIVCPITRKVICKEGFGGNLCELPTFVNDIQVFVQALTTPDIYNTEHSDCDLVNMDFNCYGLYPNGGDTDYFVATLANSWLMCNQSMICADHDTSTSGIQTCWCEDPNNPGDSLNPLNSEGLACPNADRCNQNCKPLEE